MSLRVRVRLGVARRRRRRRRRVRNRARGGVIGTHACLAVEDFGRGFWWADWAWFCGRVAQWQILLDVTIGILSKVIEALQV
jgi:hypothetical protein